jgi:hypothetical protein
MSALVYQKKPVHVTALQYNGHNLIEMMAFIKGPVVVEAGSGIFINTLEGRMHVSEGDYVICGVKGEFYPCKPDIFTATYEEVLEP